jgi:hypothetical protein
MVLQGVLLSANKIITLCILSEKSAKVGIFPFKWDKLTPQF